MQENEIFAQILNDFLAENTMVDKDVLQQFCDYARGWFLKSGVIGVAQTSNGFSLRFKDGSEKILFSPEREYSVADQPSLSISGSSGGSVRISAPEADTSIKITG